MKSVYLLLAAVASIATPSVAAVTLDDIAGKLARTGCYKAQARYEVLLASLSEPVTYTVDLESTAAPADTLAPCNYIIEWTLPHAGGNSQGFSAYFDGDHYRFRNKSLQEYHVSESKEPFSPGGRTDRGVQRQAQFVSLLPQFMAEMFAQMAVDSSYVVTVVPDTVFDGTAATVVKGVRQTDGVDVSEYVYVLDPETFLPRSIDLENNPGQIGEQSISIHFNAPATPPECKVTYARLVDAWPDAFGKYRESAFGVESLPGRPMPRIVAPTTTGERYLHERGQGFAVPVIVAFLDTSTGSTPDVVGQVRGAVALLPFQVDVIWAFVNHRIDDVESIVPQVLPGEHLLINASGAARNCGVGNTLPVLVFAAADGNVTDILVGFNNNLASDVIQKATTAKHK